MRSYSDDARFSDNIRAFIRSISRPIRRSFWRDWKTATIQTINCGLLLYFLSLIVERTLNSAFYKEDESGYQTDFSLSIVFLLFIAYLLEKTREYEWQSMLFTTRPYARTWLFRLILLNVFSHLAVKHVFSLWLTTSEGSTESLESDK